MASNKASEAIGTTEEIAPGGARTDPVAPTSHEIDANDVVTEEKKVLSVELTDAIAKDQPKYLSKRQFQLFCFVGFVTLSTLYFLALRFLPLGLN
jgi:hypothetical protein